MILTKKFIDNFSFIFLLLFHNEPKRDKQRTWRVSRPSYHTNHSRLRLIRT